MEDVIFTVLVLGLFVLLCLAVFDVRSLFINMPQSAEEIIKEFETGEIIDSKIGYSAPIPSLTIRWRDKRVTASWFSGTYSPCDLIINGTRFPYNTAVGNQICRAAQKRARKMLSERLDKIEQEIKNP